MNKVLYFHSRSKFGASMALVRSELELGKTSSCALLKNVKNADELKKQLITGQLKCTLIKPSLIVDLFHINAAANKAIISESHGKLTTKSIYTEVLFNLSLSKNISQSLLKFGVGDTDTELILLSLEDELEVRKILSQIDGDILDVTELGNLSNIDEIRKTYKVSDCELSVSSLINIIVSKIATKDFVNY